MGKRPEQGPRHTVGNLSNIGITFQVFGALVSGSWISVLRRTLFFWGARRSSAAYCGTRGAQPSNSRWGGGRMPFSSFLGTARR